jgi:ribonuclease T2
MQILSLLPFAAILGAVSAHFPHCTPRDLSVLSCHNTSAVNTCCSEYPSGILLLAQYWAPGWNSSLGPATSWTLHGLWPDFCDGTYPAYCDVTREYADPVELVKERDYGLWMWMNEYWVDVEGYEEGLWKHEWDKHGTCMSTLEPGVSFPQLRGEAALMGIVLWTQV